MNLAAVAIKIPQSWKEIIVFIVQENEKKGGPRDLVYKHRLNTKYPMPRSIRIKIQRTRDKSSKNK